MSFMNDYRYAFRDCLSDPYQIIKRPTASRYDYTRNKNDII